MDRSSLKAVTEVRCGSPVPSVQLGFSPGLGSGAKFPTSSTENQCSVLGTDKGLSVFIMAAGPRGSSEHPVFPLSPCGRQSSALNWGPVFLVLCSGRQEHMEAAGGGECWVEAGPALCPRPTQVQFHLRLICQALIKPPLLLLFALCFPEART